MDARRFEKDQQQAKAWDLWLDCMEQQDIAAEIGVSQQTVSDWLTDKRNSADFGTAPASRQHFDLWQFGTADLRPRGDGTPSTRSACSASRRNHIRSSGLRSRPSTALE